MLRLREQLALMAEERDRLLQVGCSRVGCASWGRHTYIAQRLALLVRLCRLAPCLGPARPAAARPPLSPHLLHRPLQEVHELRELRGHHPVASTPRVFDMDDPHPLRAPFGRLRVG